MSKIRSHFLAAVAGVFLVLAFVFVFPPARRAVAQAPEPVSNTRSGRPIVVLLTKRAVLSSAVLDLCTLTQGTSATSRECTVTNHSDVNLCIKYTATDVDCSGVTIASGCTSETDMAYLKPGSSYTAVFPSNTASLCGQLETSPAGNCTTPSSNDCIYTAEVL